MEYIIISFVTILFSTLCVYKIANSLLAIRLSLKPLLLCAACAMFISLILPRLIVGQTNFLGTLIGLVIFSILVAYFIAYYDAGEKKTKTKADNATLPEDICQDKPANEAAATTIVNSNNSPALSLAHKQASLTASGEASEIAELPIVTADLAAKAIIKTVAVVEAQCINNDCPDVNANTIELNQKSEKQASGDDNSSTESERVACAKLDLTKFQSLDELLDEAFTQKEAGNITQSFQLFEYALQRYPDSEAAPYIIIELGSILKSRGHYDEAVELFIKGRSLEALRRNSTFDQEFTQTIAYLRIIKNTLLKHRLGFIPYEDIPSAVIQEIDDEFREWRNQG